MITGMQQPKSMADEDLGPENPFYSLLLEKRHLPRQRRQPGLSRAWFLSDQIEDEWHTREIDDASGLQDWLDRLRVQHNPLKGALVVETIEDKMISVLLQMYPSIDLEFLHQHVSACDSPKRAPSSGSTAYLTLSPSPGFPLSVSGAHFDGIRTNNHPESHLRDKLGGPAKTGTSFCQDTDMPFTHGSPYRTEEFVANGSKWEKVSTRISCCTLTSDLCMCETRSFLPSLTDVKNIDLVIVDAPLHPGNTNGTRRYSLRTSHWILPTGTIEGSPFVPIDVLAEVFAAFGQDAVLQFMSMRSGRRGQSALPGAAHDAASRAERRAFVFHSLLAVGEFRSLVERFESDMRDLQYQVIESLDRKSLMLLRNFRSRLARLREVAAETRTRLLRPRYAAMWLRTADFLGTQVDEHSPRMSSEGMEAIRTTSTCDAQQAEFPEELSLSATTLQSGQCNEKDMNADAAMEMPRALNMLTVIDSIAKLEDRLEVVSKTVNDEIQLFIASVSIRDSEIMREDSRVMKQQAVRTSQLTTLAIIYLPLQLITGIFGMNIKEITGSGSTRWWTCVLAFPVLGLLTYMIFEVVGWWRKWTDPLQYGVERKKEESDSKKDV